MPLSAEDKTALAALEQRRVSNIGQQIDNGELPAGSPMHYYCWSCGAHVATKPEEWYEDPPPHHCANCKDLLKAGLITAGMDEYDGWLRARGEAPVRR
jgi:hypothetical protein